MTNAYEDRDKLLAAMGFPTYADYLKSGLWEWVKSQLNALGTSTPGPRKCFWCHSEIGLVWHHLRYDMPTLVGNISFPDWEFLRNARDGRDGPRLPPLVRLCHECHRLAHYENGEFITDLDRTNQRIATRSTGPAETVGEF